MGHQLHHTVTHTATPNPYRDGDELRAAECSMGPNTRTPYSVDKPDDASAAVTAPIDAARAGDTISEYTIYDLQH